jgi:ABC-type transport system substrate-binding protein
LKFRHLIPAVILLFLSSTFLGCSNAPPGTGIAGKDGEPSVFRVPIIGDPQSLDPAFIADEVSRAVGMNIFAGLLTTDEKGKVVGDLAEDWEVSPDGTVYTFNLRKGVLFHNGREVTAEDVAFSMKRCLDPAAGSPVAHFLLDIDGAAEVLEGAAEDVRGISVVDTHRIMITLSEPRPFFLARMTTPAVWVVPREEVGEGFPAWTSGKPVGAGPFVVDEVRPGDRIILNPFNDYYGGRPALDTVEMVVVTDPSVALFMYTQGELDYTRLMPAEVVQVREETELSKDLKEYPLASTFLLGLNKDKYEPFSDVRVRQAVSLALDREELCDVVWLGTRAPAAGVFAPGMPGYVARRFEVDLERAKALLWESGYEDPSRMPQLTITAPSIMEGKVMAEYIAHSLQEGLGMPVGVELLEMGAFLEKLYAYDLPLVPVGWVADYLDPDAFMNSLWHSKSPYNMVRFASAEMDSILEEAARTQDEEERLSLYERAEDIALEDCSWIPLFYERSIVLVKPYVKGLRHNMMGVLPLDGVTIER